MLIHVPPYPASSYEHKLLHSFTGLKDVQLRAKWETEEGVFLAESHKVIQRALEAGHEPLAFLVTPRWLDQLCSLPAIDERAITSGSLPVFIVSEEESASITGFSVHRGSIGLFKRPTQQVAAALLNECAEAGNKPVLVLEGLVDHTNVGAIFRSAAALGAGALLVTPDCADPLYRRSIRVSMGAVFQVPWTRLAHWPDLSIFRDAGYLTAALTPRPEAMPLDIYMREIAAQKSHTPGLAILLGSEGPGLKEATLRQADAWVRIPLDHDVDSLNVQTAGALALWEARQLRVRPGA